MGRNTKNQDLLLGEIMGKIIEFDNDEIQLLKNEMSYLIKKETQEHERLLSDKKAGSIWDEETHDRGATHVHDFQAEK